MILVLVIGGVVVGGIAAWLRQSKWRRAARLAKAQARELRAEVDRLKRRMGELPAEPMPVGYPPRLTIPPPRRELRILSRRINRLAGQDKLPAAM